MAEQLVAIRRAAVPHHGPVSPGCPVECLLTVLSLYSFNPLARADGAPWGEPRTVGDVVTLHARRQLRKIRDLGPRRISEIEAALVLAGLDLTGQRERPAGGEGPVR
ncbi:MAG TPA: hypothetical protein VMG13_14880 [Trebonia sp.]|nr:hypothetical protein [Trebonia sp.]